eukprot:9627834-Alexandrium_andersonii.AAC.1
MPRAVGSCTSACSPTCARRTGGSSTARRTGLQACGLKPPFLWVNRVGAFGVGTACYWWSRLAG